VRADPDFTAYVVARWAPAVRVLVVLGVPPERADELAVETFARLLPDWARMRREGDVDVELGRVVLDAWARQRGAASEPAERERTPVAAGRVLTRELEEQLAMLDRLAVGLAGVDETTRLTVVLRHLGELEVEQVGDVLGEPPAEVGRRLSAAALALDLVPLDPACHAAAGAIDVPPPPVDRVVATAAATRRRRWLVSAGAAAALVLVVGAAFVITRPDPPPVRALDPLDVTEVENPVGAVWWLDGTLHLAHGTAPVPDVVQIADAGFGIAYADSDGNVVWLTDDGRRERIGSLDTATALVAQGSAGRVAWLEPGRGDLVVWSAVAQDVVLARPRATDSQLIGWDRDRLYFHQEGRDHSVDFINLSGSEVTTVDPPDNLPTSQLVDVASGAELRRQDGVLSTTQPFFSVSPPVSGLTGALSPDGNYVLTLDGSGVPSAYDARNGQRYPSWFDPTWGPVAAAFTRDDRVVWVADEHNGSYGLVDCQVEERLVTAFDPDAQRCDRPLDVSGVPVLADVRPGLVPDGS
jgi:DNA-directed RNA polymerase specialized sigma24 family protein